MSNQTATFDKSFISARIDDCILICSFQVKNGFPNSTLFQQSYDQGISWITNFGHKSGLLPHDLQDAQDHLNSLYDTFISYCCEKVNSTLDSSEELQNVEQPTIRQTDDSAAQPVAPSQLSMFSLFCKKAKFFSLSTQNEYPGWDHYYKASFHPFARPTLTVTKRILSHTRPVGGLA